jgi:hypothetical protein
MCPVCNSTMVKYNIVITSDRGRLTSAVEFESSLKSDLLFSVIGGESSHRISFSLVQVGNVCRDIRLVCSDLGSTAWRNVKVNLQLNLKRWRG